MVNAVPILSKKLIADAFFRLLFEEILSSRGPLSTVLW